MALLSGAMGEETHLVQLASKYFESILERKEKISIGSVILNNFLLKSVLHNLLISSL